MGIQRQLPAGMVLEVAYIGNHAVHLPFSTQLDFIPRQYLSTSLYRDASENATVNLLGSSAKGANGTAIVNPFQGLLPNSQLQRRYGQLTTVIDSVPSISGTVRSREHQQRGRRAIYQRRRILPPASTSAYKSVGRMVCCLSKTLPTAPWSKEWTI